MLEKLVYIILIIFYFVASLNANDCIKAYTGEKEGNITTRTIYISGCEAPPCALQVGTNIEIMQVFQPEKNIEYLTTSVVAKMRFINLPFWGVNGEDVFFDIYDINGNIAEWPLIACNIYLYKRQFPVKEYYPRWNLIVRWKLLENGNDITCFEVPVKIIDQLE